MPSGILQTDTSKQNRNSYARQTGASAYPDAVALREALQNPAANLCAELDLHQATVARDRYGFPLAYTGRFAVVFRLELPGGVPVALRLFTSAEKDFVGERAERLHRTSELLRAKENQLGDLLPPPIYLPEAVRGAGEWYPAQVLPWAEGQTLLAFVEQHRSDSEALRTLAQTIADAVTRMEAAGIAHGDLQHDNILVADAGRRITLVDYDALFASELCDLAPPVERGHRHYQHPDRSVSHYGVGIDRFASAVIRTGLLLLASDPTLWTRLDGSYGEGILFAEDDFRAPQVSALFAAAREVGEQDADLSCALGELDALVQLPEPTVVSLKRLPTVKLAAPACRPPARVTPTCEEEKIKPVSYLAPLYTPAFRRADRVNAHAVRAYSVAVPPLIAMTWTAAWSDGAAKWEFLAYLLAISAVLLFFFLYLTWGVKQQYDALGTELGKLRLVKQRANEMQRALRQRLRRLVPRPIEPRQEQAFLLQILAQIPVSRAIGDRSVSPEAVRVLRERGIQSAAQLWRRHGFLPGAITGADAALLREWLRDEEAAAHRQFVREMMPEERIREALRESESATARTEARLADLRRELAEFPEASVAAFLRRILPAPRLQEGTGTVCGE